MKKIIIVKLKFADVLIYSLSIKNYTYIIINNAQIVSVIIKFSEERNR